MSEAQREQVGALLDSVDETFVAALAERTRLGPNDDARRAKVRALFEEAFMSAARAMEEGLIDGVCYADRLADEVGVDALVRAPRYLAVRRARRAMFDARPYIAILPIHGAIAQESSASSGSSAVSGPIIAALRALKKDAWARAVVLHVDSPGGSALASDLIHREVELLAETKPVIACFGEVAASGGYYVAAPARTIVAHPLTVTGSIGVVSARLVTDELAARIGVHTEVVSRAPHADLLGNARALTDTEHGIFEREVEGFYRAFVKVVARGRKQSEERIEELARGRVWSGVDAHARGLVDRLGGLPEAVQAAKDALGLPAFMTRLVGEQVFWPQAEEPSWTRLLATSLVPRTWLPELTQLVQLAGAGDRVLLFAPFLPRID
jgi:protease IV